MDTRRVLKLGGKVGHVTRHAGHLFKVERSRSQGHITCQHRERYNSAVDGHVNFKLGENYRTGSLRL